MPLATTSRFRFIGTLLVSFATGACSRGDQAAPPAGASQPPTTTASQPSSTIASQQSPAVLGFDSVITLKRPESTCYASERYVVVERELMTQVGGDLYVRPRGAPDAAPRCDADSSAGDIVFRTGEPVARHPDAQHFLGLKGDLLIAWDGTGAASDLYIYDLNKRAKVLMLPDADDTSLEWLSPTTVGVWMTKAFAEHAAAAGCPDTVPSMFPQLDSLVSLDLPTLTLRPTGRYRCTVSQ